MHVSVTTLGASAGELKRAAGQVVGYLEGNQPGQTNRRNLPGTRAPDVGPITSALQSEGGPSGYYADAAEAPGRWRGAGTRPDAYDLGSVVQPEHFRRVLLGEDPHTGEQLIETRPKTTGRGPFSVDLEAGSLTLSEAADRLGIDDSYLRRLARETAGIRAEQATAERSGTPEPELPASYLDATKTKGRWMIDPAELERFARERGEPKIVMGYDVTWSVPKSVSMLYAAGDDTLSDRIDLAIDTAVQAGMSYLESEGFHVRDGRDRSRASQMIAASYRHTTNRALEPQLHEHVVIANMATSPTGQIRAVDARGLFAHATPAGYLAAAQLRHDLRQFGIAWGPVHKGLADIAGIDRDQIMALSSRRQDVLSLSAELGYLTPQARQTAALATRPGKTTSVDREELFARWRQLLEDVGIGHQRVAELTGHDPSRPLWSPDDTDRLFRHLSGSHGVTEQSAIFDRRHVIEAVATYAVDRLPAADIIDLADHWLSTDAAIELEISDSGRRETIGTGAAQVSLTPDERRYTTPEMLDIETRVINWHNQGVRTGHALVRPAIVESAITNSSVELGADQADLVRALTTSGDQFQAAQGLAGSGKTTALRAAVEAWHDAGYSVIGAAPFGEAARKLEAETGVESRTLEALLHRIELAGDPRQVVGSSTVVLVDEASTIGNRQLHRLYRAAAETGASVRTIGDPRQHQSVEAGGLWAHLTDRFDDRTPVLGTNRRQTGPDMAEVRLALGDYRNGLIAAAIDRLEDDNRIMVTDTWDDLLDQMAADWYVDHQRHRAGHTIGSQMIAERNADRHALNHRAQAWLRHDGTLTHPTRIGDDTFHLGDRVVAQRPDKTLTTDDSDPRAHIINGSVGTITAIRGDRTRPDLIVDFDHLGTIRIPHEFIASEVGPGRGGGLSPAYAVTSYKAEGQTYDTARGLAAPGAINTEGMYVALTRGRNDLRVYSIAPADQRTEPPELPVIDDTRAATQALTDTLDRWHGSDIATVADPQAAHTRSLAARTPTDLNHAGSPEAERVRRAIEIRITGHAVANPDPTLVAHLGQRPTSGAHRTAWDEAVARHALYHHHWTTNSTADKAPLPPLQGTESPAQQRGHTETAEAIEQARIRHLATTPLNELRAMHQDADAASQSLPAPPKVLDRLISEAEAEVRRLTAHIRSATAQHLALSTAPRTSPDRIETTRRRVRDAEVNLASAQQRLHTSRTLRSAASGDPAARADVQRLRTTIDLAIDQKIISAVRNPAPYLTSAIGPRPPRNDPRRERWNRAASHLESYRHKVLGLAPSEGALRGSGVEVAIGARPVARLLTGRWLRAARPARDLQSAELRVKTQARRIT